LVIVVRALAWQVGGALLVANRRPASALDLHHHPWRSTAGASLPLLFHPGWAWIQPFDCRPPIHHHRTTLGRGVHLPADRSCLLNHVGLTP